MAPIALGPAATEPASKLDTISPLKGAVNGHNANGSTDNYTTQLITFVTNLKYSDIPADVVSRTKELFADWACCSMSGAGYPSVVAFEKFAESMGPANGSSTILADGKLRTTSSFFASLVNAAGSHVTEQDDLHMASVSHPATAIFPAALAAAQEVHATGKDLILACVAGYEVACRTGEMLGRKHYKIFHTTGTAGTLGAAIAVGKLLNLSLDQMLNALGTAGTQTAGLFEYGATAGADSKQVHPAHAASIGLLSAFTARDGLTGARDILLGSRGLAKGTAFGEENPRALVQGLGQNWKMTESSFKWLASCRHTHPSADALKLLLSKHPLKPSEIKSITARTYSEALGLQNFEPGVTVHGSKFTMSFVLSVIATKGDALLNHFGEHALADPEIRAMQKKCRMVFDDEMEANYPAQWSGRVTVETDDGQTFTETVKCSKGDPDWTLTRDEIMSKGQNLAVYGKSPLAGPRLKQFFTKVWQLDDISDVSGLFE